MKENFPSQQYGNPAAEIVPPRGVLTPDGWTPVPDPAVRPKTFVNSSDLIGSQAGNQPYAEFTPADSTATIPGAENPHTAANAEVPPAADTAAMRVVYRDGVIGHQQ